MVVGVYRRVGLWYRRYSEQCTSVCSATSAYGTCHRCAEQLQPSTLRLATSTSSSVNICSSAKGASGCCCCCCCCCCCSCRRSNHAINHEDKIVPSVARARVLTITWQHQSSSDGCSSSNSSSSGESNDSISCFVGESF